MTAVGAGQNRDIYIKVFLKQHESRVLKDPHSKDFGIPWINRRRSSRRVSLQHRTDRGNRDWGGESQCDVPTKVKQSEQSAAQGRCNLENLGINRDSAVGQRKSAIYDSHTVCHAFGRKTTSQALRAQKAVSGGCAMKSSHNGLLRSEGSSIGSTQSKPTNPMSRMVSS